MTMKNTYMVASVVVFLLLFSGWIWRGNTALEVNEYEMISNRICMAIKVTSTYI